MAKMSFFIFPPQLSILSFMYPFISSALPEENKKKKTSKPRTFSCALKCRLLNKT